MYFKVIRWSRVILRLAIVVMALSFLYFYPIVHAATFNVNSTSDTVDANIGNGVCADSNGNCTLRAAIQESNSLAGTDTINVPDGTYTLTRSGTDNTAVNGDLDITQSVNIVGASAQNTIFQAGTSLANDVDRFFDIVTSGTVITMSNFTIRNSGDGQSGGAIQSVSNSLTLSDLIISNNQSNQGAIYLSGSSTLTEVIVQSNTGNDGGGIYYVSGTHALNNSLINSNSSSSDGGGLLLNNGSGPVTVRNTTIVANSANDFGGGIFNNGTLNLYNLTIANNTASTGPAIHGGAISNIRNTIISNNNCSMSAPTSQSFNIDSGTSCGFGSNNNSLSSTNPQLGTLQDNGGFSFTMAITETSPAYDTGTDLTAQGVTTDQRGIARPQGSSYDRGAFEVEVVSGPPCNPANNGSGSSSGGTGTVSLTLTLCGAGSLSIDSPASITLSSVTVSSIVTTSSGTSANIIFEDTRQAAPGWSATVTITNFVGQTNNTKILSLANDTSATTSYFRIQPSALSAESGTLTGLTDSTFLQNITSLSSLGAGGVSNPFTLATFTSGNGVGRYNKQVSIQLDIQPYATPQIYSSTMTFSVS